MKRGDLITRTDPKYYALYEILQSRFPLHRLGTLVLTEPDYGSGARAVKRISKDAPRYIRITDFGEDGIEPGHQFLTADPIEIDYQLSADDVLFARSGATVGKTYLHEDTNEPAIFAGYCIRFRFDKLRVFPRFVYWWTKTAAYSRWVAAIQRPAGQPNINKAEFKSCPIPLPSLTKQEELLIWIDSAREKRKAKLAEADALLAGIDAFLLDVLGLHPAATDNRRVFAVRHQVARQRLDPHFHAPEFAQIQALLLRTRCQSLGSIATFSRETWKSQDHKQPTFRYIEINAVNPKTGEPSWNEIPTLEAPSRARMKVRVDDIIVSLTRPHHGSIAHLGPEFEGCVASTGFAVIRDVAAHVRRDYLWCVLRAKFSLSQMLQRTSGGNYPAITEQELANIAVPIPEKKVQESIAIEVHRRQRKIMKLHAEAEGGWQAAKLWFEEQLLGPTAS